jgi:hypothetical protein
MLQAVEEHNAQDLAKLQEEADTARARASTAESRAAESAAKVASLTEELAAAEAALEAARREGQEALEAARVQHEADLQQEKQKLGQAKGAVRKSEEELAQRIAALEVCRGHFGGSGCCARVGAQCGASCWLERQQNLAFWGQGSCSTAHWEGILLDRLYDASSAPPIRCSNPIQRGMQWLKPPLV